MVNILKIQGHRINPIPIWSFGRLSYLFRNTRHIASQALLRSSLGAQRALATVHTHETSARARDRSPYMCRIRTVLVKYWEYTLSGLESSYSLVDLPVCIRIEVLSSVAQLKKTTRTPVNVTVCTRRVYIYSSNLYGCGPLVRWTGLAYSLLDFIKCVYARPWDLCCDLSLSLNCT